MLPNNPSSYVIPSSIQFEIDALVRDLDLVLVCKSFAPLPDSRFIHEYSPLPKLVIKPIEEGRLSAADFYKRNHTYVRKSDYYKEGCSGLWD